MLDARISALIGSIYERVHEEEDLAAVAETILAEVDGSFGLVALADCGEGRFARAEYLVRATSSHLDTVRQYEAEMQPRDPAFDFVRRNPTAGLFVAPRHAGRQDDEDGDYLRWVRDRFGTADWMLAFTPPVGDYSFGASAHAAPGSQFTEQDRDLFRLLFDHLQRAVRLRQQPIDLASHDTVVLLLSPLGGLVGVSVAGEAVLSDADALTVTGGVVLPTAAPVRRTWLALLSDAAGAFENGTAGGVVALPRRSGRRPLIATIEPLPRVAQGLRARGGVLLVRIVDPETGPGRDAASRWALAFRLTPAETRLCEALLRCTGSLREAAHETGIAYATARVHLASIFQKTDTRSQAALAGLLTRTAQTSSRA